MGSNAGLMERRMRLLGPNVRLSRKVPQRLVRGEGCHVWDAAGRKCLDCCNNAPHVGHCHADVAAAIAALLTAQTRYLHDGTLDYVERLTASLGPQITSAIMVCTAAKANDVALRRAQAITGKTGVIATDKSYPGTTTAVPQWSTRLPPIGGIGGHGGVIIADEVQQGFGRIGTHFRGHQRAGVRRLVAARYDLVGDGRGSGLANGVQLVLNRAAKTPARDIAPRVINRMRQRGTRIGSNGIHHDALRIRPPMAFDRAEADEVIATLDDVPAPLWHFEIRRPFRPQPQRDPA